MEEALRDLQGVSISDATFPVSYQQNKFKQSSTAMLAITFIVFFAYSSIRFIVNRKSNFGTDKTAEVPEILKVIIRVVERDLAPSLLIFFYIMCLGSFYVFAAVFGYFLMLTGGMLVLAYKMNNQQMIKIFRFFLVLCTFAAFLNIFIDDMTFDDASPDRLTTFANPSATGNL